jgi:glycosyltransferase involved in cell wall biosynthesis
MGCQSGEIERVVYGREGEERMSVPDLAVIVPFCNEWSQVAFTLRSVAENLQGELDFEVIACDNYCQEVAEQNRQPDAGHDRPIRPIRIEAEDWLENPEEQEAFKSAYETLSAYWPVSVEVIGNVRGYLLNTLDKADRGHDRVEGDKHHKSAIASWAGRRKWLKYVRYDEKLSHWNAKRVGVEASSAPVLLFLDAHVVPSKGALLSQYKWLEVLRNTEGPDVTLHLPWTYHILEDHGLIYRLIDNRDTGEVHYSTCGRRAKETRPYEVSCMSTCGLMMTRALYDKMGGWPRELGIYGGGENFMNFCCSVMGVRKFITPGKLLHHHGEKRGYHWRYDDGVRNRFIANYLFGGEEWLDKYLKGLIKRGKGRPEVLEAIRATVIGPCKKQYDLIQSQAVTTIDDWLDSWKEKT